MADCYHVWIFNSNNKGMVGAATIRRKCLSRNGANQNLKAKTSGTFAKIKPRYGFGLYGRRVPLRDAGAWLRSGDDDEYGDSRCCAVSTVLETSRHGEG